MSICCRPGIEARNSTPSKDSNARWNVTICIASDRARGSLTGVTSTKPGVVISVKALAARAEPDVAASAQAGARLRHATSHAATPATDPSD